jgi:hypothetical protein
MVPVCLVSTSAGVRARSGPSPSVAPSGAFLSSAP